MMSQWNFKYIKSISLAIIQNRLLKYYMEKLYLQKEMTNTTIGKFMIPMKKKLHI